jgi:hypothetical protein
MTTTRRGHLIGTRIVAVLFALLGLNALNELLSMVSGTSGGPAALAVLQAVVGLTAIATAFGAWIGARWAPLLAALYGVITAGMIVALGPLLEMPAEERGGLLVGGAIVLAFALACAGYLYWASRRARAPTPADAP